MNNFKKIGLTALAGSLVVTSAFAGELTVSGDASMRVSNTTGTGDAGAGKQFRMGNSVYLAGSGELDNGMTVSMSFEMDQGASADTSSPFDNHYVEVGSDALGTLRLSGHGGSTAQSAMDTTAAGDLWNNTLGINGNAGPTSSAGNNSLFYTFPSLVDGVKLTTSLTPGGANVANASTHMAYGVSYTGVEGLTLNYGIGDSATQTAEVENTTMSASYAIGSLTLSVSRTENDSASTATTQEWDSYQVAYTISENISATYGSETLDDADSAVDQEVTGFGISYTTGGMTISASQINAEGGGNVATADTDRWNLSAAFAF
jgi:outer membrane protein OmpU